MTVVPAGSVARASVTIAGSASTATTRPRGSRSSSRAVTRPVPHPASSTVSSPASGSRSSTWSAMPSMTAETLWYDDASQSRRNAAHPASSVTALSMRRCRVSAVLAPSTDSTCRRWLL